MDGSMIDFLYIAFLVIVVLGGVVCLLIFLPKEHDLEDSTSDCYRIMFKNGTYSVSHGKPGLGENLFSIGAKYSYLKKVPFVVDCFYDGEDDGIPYSAASTVTLHFPEDKISIFAPTFSGLTHESVEETLSETASVALKELAADCSGEEKPEELKEIFKEKVKKKLEIFGVNVMSVGELRMKKRQ